MVYIIDVVSPSQIIKSLGSSTCALGFTVIVNVCDIPSQLISSVNNGVTTTVATIGSVPVLIAVKDGKSPDPVAAKPIAGVSFVQV